MTQVCSSCGSTAIHMIGKHGWVLCKDCGRDGPQVSEDNYEPSETQQGLTPIPDGYAEQ